MAHATLAKYNLTLAQANDTKAKGNEDQTEAREQLGKEFFGMPWTRQIANAVAKLFFCTYFYQKLGPNTDNVRHTFVGRHSNAITAQEMTEYLVMSVHREAKLYMRGTTNHYSTYRAFAQAAQQHISFRAREMLAASLKGETVEVMDSGNKVAPGISSIDKGMGLVLASVYEKEQKANEQFLTTVAVTIKTKKSTERYAGDYSARAAGAKYGSTVSFNRQIK